MRARVWSDCVRFVACFVYASIRVYLYIVAVDLLFGIRTIWYSPNITFSGIRTHKKTFVWPLGELGLSLNPFLKIKIVNYLKSKSN